MRDKVKQFIESRIFSHYQFGDTWFQPTFLGSRNGETKPNGIWHLSKSLPRKASITRWWELGTWLWLLGSLAVVGTEPLLSPQKNPGCLAFWNDWASLAEAGDISCHIPVPTYFSGTVAKDCTMSVPCIPLQAPSPSIYLSALGLSPKSLKAAQAQAQSLSLLTHLDSIDRS